MSEPGGRRRGRLTVARMEAPVRHVAARPASPSRTFNQRQLAPSQAPMRGLARRDSVPRSPLSHQS